MLVRSGIVIAPRHHAGFFFQSAFDDFDRMPNRRSFVAAACGAAAASAFANNGGLFRSGDSAPPPIDDPTTDNQRATTKARSNPWCVFTKPLQSMKPNAMARSLAKIGFDGTECAIRKGGMIEPDQAADRLPAHLDALAGENLDITIATTGILDPDDSTTATLLDLFRQHGVVRYRMGYFRYAKNQPLPPQIDRWRSKLTDLAAINAQYGIQGLYQNHAGFRMFGGPIWDLYDGIKEIDPDHLGVAYDLRHAAVEGGLSWPLQWQLIKDHVRAFYVKDFRWVDDKPVSVPLGSGIADRDFYRNLDLRFKAMPMSIHEEYIDHKDPSLVPQHLAAINRDYQTLQKMVSAK